MSQFSISAINFLERVRSSARFRYSEFQMIDHAINFLRKKPDEEIRNLHFQITVYEESFNSHYYLQFSEEGIRFQHYIFDHDNNANPIDIFFSYSPDITNDYANGHLEDWNQEVGELLSRYERDEQESEVCIDFSDSY